MFSTNNTDHYAKTLPIRLRGYMSFSLSPCSDANTWNKFVNDSPQGSIFCHTDFLETLGETYELYFITEQDHPVAAFVLLMQHDRPLPAPYPFTCYQGIMLGSEIENLPPHRKTPHRLKIMEYILGELSGKYKTISFCLHPHFEDLRAFLWFNYHEPSQGQFKIDLRYTGILDLHNITSDEQYMTMVRTVRRQEYTRAIKEGVTIEDSDDINLLDQLHELTFKRQSIDRSTAETRLLRSIAKQSLAKNFGKLKIARTAAGEIASAILCLYDHRCAYYLIAANHPDFRKTFASTLLLFHMINAFREKGLQYFDFVGINSPNRGDYKISFNVEPKSYNITNWQTPA